ncbi:PIN domain-containing protein [Candidatus Bipolaricaulota bacterium]|nr:PIN domain-containing protein [Candidatus Bipolaricaulota bacterium]
MPKKQDRKVTYWDTCIFLAWLKDEQRQDHDMDGVYNAVDDTKKGKIVVLTASTTFGEVRETRHSEAWEKFERFMQRRNVRVVDIDPRIHALAAELRDFYKSLHARDGNGLLKVLDSEHLATALRYKADKFYTFDNGRKGDRSLLSLNGNVAGYDLAICKPPVRQMRLDL